MTGLVWPSFLIIIILGRNQEFMCHLAGAMRTKDQAVFANSNQGPSGAEQAGRLGVGQDGMLGNWAKMEEASIQKL